MPGVPYVEDYAERAEQTYDKLKSASDLIRELTAKLNGSLSRSASFQREVVDWVRGCFGSEVAADINQRNHRLLEEVLELVQSLGCTRADAHVLVDYVFDRPVGETEQEIGGVMVGIAALCGAVSIDMNDAGRKELDRAWKNIDLIKQKWHTKPKPGTGVPSMHAVAVIDGLLALMVQKAIWREGKPDMDYNAVDLAVKWLNRYATSEQWLTTFTRDLMEKAK